MVRKGQSVHVDHVRLCSPLRISGLKTFKREELAWRWLKFCNRFKEIIKSILKPLLIAVAIAVVYVILVQRLPFVLLVLRIFEAPISENVLFGLLAYGWAPLSSIIFIAILAAAPRFKERSNARVESRPTAFRTFVENPSHILLISVPAAVLYMLFVPLKTLTFIMAFLLAAVPYALFYELKAMKTPRPDAPIPNFLKSLPGTWRWIPALIVVVSFLYLLFETFFIVDAYLRLPIGVIPPTGELELAEPMEVKLLFYRMFALQAVFSGLVMGQVRSGDFRRGFKYAIFLSVVVFIVFEWSILPLALPLPMPTG
jgi:hypothetical protein